MIFFRNEFLEKSRFAKIAHHVAVTMETVNLNEMTHDQPLAHLVNLFFMRNVSCSSVVVEFQLTATNDDTFELKNILCVPIMDGDGRVIGVCQVMNKLNERIFTDDDVAIIEVEFNTREINLVNRIMYSL